MINYLYHYYNNMATVVQTTPQQKERCDLCKRFLRIKIISANPIKYEIYGNPTSQYGGLFCSSYCSLNYTKIIKKKLKDQQVSLS